jgi:hypothetical protein
LLKPRWPAHWAQDQAAGAKGKVGDAVLDDLGGPLNVGQALSFMGPKQKKGAAGDDGGA